MIFLKYSNILCYKKLLPSLKVVPNPSFYFERYGNKISLLFNPRFSDPAWGIDPGRGEGQRVKGSIGSNRGSIKGIDPVYI